MITFRVGCNHKPCVDMGKSLLGGDGQKRHGCKFVVISLRKCIYYDAVSLNLVMFGKCKNNPCKYRAHARCMQGKQTVHTWALGRARLLYCIFQYVTARMSSSFLSCCTEACKYT